MILPALSVKQPHAGLIWQGTKRIETRLWATGYRGPLVICSSLEPRGFGLSGYAGCVVMLKRIERMSPTDWELARCPEYDWALGWWFGKRWPLYPFRVRGARGLFAVTVPEPSFPDPQDRHEVLTALEWAERNDVLQYVHGF